MRHTTKVLLALAACAGFAANAQAELTAAWTISPLADRAWYTTASVAANSRTVRGVTYSSTADKVYILSRTPAPGIVQINPVDGADFAAHLPFGAAVSGGTFTANMIDVDDDATAQVIYFCNLTTNVTTSAFKIYRMTNPADVATITEAFNGTIADIGAVRMGDTLSVTGSGTGTEIYAGTGGAGASLASLVLFTTANGTTFTKASQKFFSSETVSRNRLGLSVEGTGASAIIWGNTSGQIPVLISATAESLTPATYLGDVANASPINLATVGFKTIGGTAYVALGIGNPASSATAASAPLATPDVDRHALYTAVGADLTLVDRTASVTNLTADAGDDATFIYPNGDGTGAVAFDTTRNRVVFVSTNQTIGSYAIPATNVSDWNLF